MRSAMNQEVYEEVQICIKWTFERLVTYLHFACLAGCTLWLSHCANAIIISVIPVPISNDDFHDDDAAANDRERV